MNLGLVTYASIADGLEGMISSVDLNGPAILVDTAISFCAAVSALRRSESPAASAITSERLLHWFFARWSPGQFST